MIVKGMGVALATLLFSSCNTLKEYAKEELIESIVDPKTGTQVLTREYDTSSYSINAGGIIKARKQKRKQKLREVLENYDKPAKP